VSPGFGRAPRPFQSSGAVVVRRPREIERVCDEEPSLGEELPRPREEPSGADPWTSAQARVGGARRWLAMALVGALIGIVAALAAHGLRGSGAVVGGRGGLSQPGPLAPATPRWSGGDDAQRPAHSAQARVGGARARAREARPTATVLKPVAESPVGVVEAHYSVSAHEIVRTHEPIPAAVEAPSGAQFELGFER